MSFAACGKASDMELATTKFRMKLFLVLFLSRKRTLS